MTTTRSATTESDSLTDQLQERARQVTVPPRVARARSNLILKVAIGAFLAFFSLLLIVRRTPRMERDVVATIRLQRFHHPSLTVAMSFVSWFGFRPQSLVLPGATVAGTWLIGFRREARYLAFAWLGSMMSYTTKRFVKRPRPGGDGIVVQHADLRDTSFPSGHTLHYTAFWGFFAYLCFTEIRNRWFRWIPVGGITALIGFVGPSRVYLGHHWLTDVLASYSLGISYLATLIGLHRRDLGEDSPWSLDEDADSR